MPRSTEECSLLQSKYVNERGQGGRLISTARIVKKVSGERWAPVSQHLNQASRRNQVREHILHRSSNSNSIQHRLDHEVRIVERNRSLGAHCQRLPAFLKLPSVETIAEAEADAGVIFQILRMARDGFRFEICWRANDRQTHFPGYADSDHIALDELTELNTGVILPRYKINGVVRRSDFKDDFRISASKLSQLWQQHHLRSRSWNDQANAACRMLALLSSFGNRPLNPFERRAKFTEESGAGGGWSDAACSPSEQL